LTTPVAIAGWGMKGSHEPDTLRDAADGWMFTTSDKALAPNRVYFNGYLAPSGASGIGTGAFGTNPNLATLGTQFDMGGPSQFRAILGAWKDCNKDDYVGFGDQGLYEYRATLLLDASICPARPGVPTPGSMPAHNDGTWVKELIPIVWGDYYSGDANPWDAHDRGARVWADYGKPGETARPSLDCNLGGAPRGTFASTGGLLWYVDCVDGYRVTDTFDGIANNNPTLRPYSFSDHPRDQYNSASQANRPNPFGQQSDASYVETWDCSRPQIAQVDASISQSHDPLGLGPDPTGTGYVGGGTDPLGTGGALIWVNVSQPRVPPSGPNLAGTPSGTLNSTGSGLDECHRETRHDDDSSFWGERWHEGSRASNLPYWALERDAARLNVAKQAPSDTLQGWYERRRPTTLAPVLGESAPPCATDVTNDCGTFLVSSDGSWGSAFDASTRYTRPELDANASANRVEYVTFYAIVSASAVTQLNLQLPSAGTGTYGAEACGATRAGVLNGWDCDPTHWWRDVNGHDVEPRAPELGPDPSSTLPCSEDPAYVTDGCMAFSARIGSPYNLRDVDCYDQSFTAARERGVGMGVLTGTSCS
jgi:hypothetical protein